MNSPKSVSRALLLLLCTILAACTLPTSEGDDTSNITGPPTVRLVAPLPNASYSVGVAVIIQASISNAGEDLSRVEFSVDDTIVATQADPNPSGVPTFSVSQSWTAEGAGQHRIGVIAFREDGTASSPAVVTINVVDPSSLSNDDDNDDSTTNATATNANAQQANDDDDNGDDTTDGNDQQQAQSTARPTNTSEPTDPPPPTDIPATNTPAVPIVQFTAGINVRSGPGTNFEPPIGNYAINDTAEVLAVHVSEQWYRVEYRGGDGWVYAPLTELQGSLNGLPREAGPATPIPQPTAVPATAVPPTATGNVNLTFANDSVSSAVPPTCGQQFTITVTVVNNGTIQSPTGRIIVEDVHTASNSVQATYDGGLLPANGLAPGQTHTIVAPLTISTFVNENHFIRIRIDPDNQITESNEGDNEQQLPYTLQAGC